MQYTTKQSNPTHTQLHITATSDELESAKQTTLKTLAKDLKLAGFRKGHAPASMVEKVVDQQLLQNKVIEHVVNSLYVEALRAADIKAVGSPEVTVVKFVPFSALEFSADVEMIGDIKLPDYKKFRFDKNVEPVTDEEVEKVIDELLVRDAEKNVVQRAAADGDEVLMDFEGVDAKTKEAIEGAAGKDYPLTLGSNTFIPGFEPELVGLQAGDTKTFDIIFPKDYGVPALQKKKVSFTVSVKEVKEIVLPKLDETFVAKIGPFKNAAELRQDIRKQIGVEKDTQAQRQLENDLLTQLGEKASVAIPETLLEEEMLRMDEDLRRNLMYRGQTWQEYLAAEGKTEEEHRAAHRPIAEQRIRTGLALGEVAEKEGIRISEEELAERITALKKQYGDKTMQEELAKSENIRDVYNRMLTEKTIAALIAYASKD